MVEATFEQAYPIAARAAKVRATAAVVSGAIPGADREDFEQEGLTACWRALPQFDPARASLRTFVEHVVAARLASLIRSANRVPASQPLDSASRCHVDSGIGSLELHADVWRLLNLLSDGDRHLVLLLMEYSPSEASRLLGIARSTVYERIQRLRRTFADAGLASEGYCRNGGQR
jgi:RNA polymerase sigma factor (sigma-70 family)